MIETTLTLSYSEAVKPAEILSVLDVNVNQVKQLWLQTKRVLLPLNFLLGFKEPSYVNRTHFFHYLRLVKKFNWFKMNEKSFKNAPINTYLNMK